MTTTNEILTDGWFLQQHAARCTVPPRDRLEGTL